VKLVSDAHEEDRRATFEELSETTILKGEIFEGI
jgi:hypothetical protein